MEEGLTYFREQFKLEDVDIRTYSPLSLAYIGDSIYDLLIRTMIMSEGNMPVQKMHRKSSLLVKAQKQSEMIQRMEPHLTEEELHIYKRGRNAKPHSVAKNASHSDYRRATGFEAVMGFLYLKKDLKRMVDLLKIGLETDGEKDGK